MERIVNCSFSLTCWMKGWDFFLNENLNKSKQSLPSLLTRRVKQHLKINDNRENIDPFFSWINCFEQYERKELDTNIEMQQKTLSLLSHVLVIQLSNQLCKTSNMKWLFIISFQVELGNCQAIDVSEMIFILARSAHHRDPRKCYRIILIAQRIYRQELEREKKTKKPEHIHVQGEDQSVE